MTRTVILLYILCYISVIVCQTCHDIDTSACLAMATTKPDICNDPDIAHSVCPSFCNTCPTTTAPTTTTMTTRTQPCEDIDSGACILFEKQTPNMCSIQAMSKFCKRYCNICPLVCYNCPTPMADLTQCTQNTSCQLGEVCLRTELRSAVDGRHEYTSGCGKREACDGVNLAAIFGKRRLTSRDVSVTCCDQDLCNNIQPITPSTTMTTATAHTLCKKDITIFLDESSSLIGNNSRIDQFLMDLAFKLPIGQDGVLTSLVTFSTTAHKKWGLLDHQDKLELMHAMNQLEFKHRPGDVDAALSYYTTHYDSGDRSDADDVVLIITDGGVSSASLRDQLAQQIHSISHDVILVELGDIEVGGQISTDNSHHLVVSNIQDLENIEPHLISLICHY